MAMQPGEVRNLLQYYTTGLRDGVRTRTNTYYVHLENADVAINNIGIPRYGDTHPDDSNLLVQNISASGRGLGSLVQVSYVPIDYWGGGQPPVNDSAEDFWGIDVSFDYEDIDIPLFRRSGLTTTDEQGLPITQLVYADYRVGIPYRKRVPYYRVTTGVTFAEPASLGDIFALSELIVDQTDKIHRLFGRDVVFSCEGLQYVSRTEYKVTYRWSQDLGIPNEWEADTAFDETLDENLGRRGSILYPFADEDFVIPPFKGMRIDGNIDPTELPLVTFFDKYKRDDNGWQNLPGLV